MVWDGYYYGVLGRNLISGRFEEGLSTYWPPLYPLLIGISSLFFSDLKFAASSVSVVAGSLLIIPVYFLIKEFYGKKAAPVGAVLVIVYPSLLIYSSVFLTEATYTLLFTTGILTGWLAISHRKSILFFLTGLLFACCYLVKPEAFAFAGLLIVLFLGAAIINKELRSIKPLLNISLFLIGFVILSSPYLLYLHQKTGRWMISQKLSMHLYGGRNLYALTEDKQGTLADRLWVGRRWEGDNPSGVTQSSGAQPTGSPSASLPVSGSQSSGSQPLGAPISKPQSSASPLGKGAATKPSANYAHAVRPGPQPASVPSTSLPLSGAQSTKSRTRRSRPGRTQDVGAQSGEAQSRGAQPGKGQPARSQQNSSQTTGAQPSASPSAVLPPGGAPSSESSPASSPSSGIQTGESELDLFSNPSGNFSYSEMFKRVIRGLPNQFKLLLQIVSPLIALLAVIGFFTGWSKERVGKELYLSSFFFSTLLGYSFTTVMYENRLLVPLMPIVICWSTKGITDIESWLAKIKLVQNSDISILNNWGVLRALIVAVLVLTLLPSIVHIIKASEKQSKGREVVGKWLKNHSAAPPRILAASPWPTFYADGQHLFLPYETYPVVVDYAKRKKIDYLVVEQELKASNRYMKFLLLNRSDENLQRIAPDLKPVYKYDQKPGAKIIVFKLNNAATGIAEQQASKN